MSGQITHRNFTLNFQTVQARQHTLNLGQNPTVMGIVNVTPDSFSDGGKFDGPKAALAQAQNLIAEGAHIIDVGGESTRPQADEIGAHDELDRVMPVLDRLRDAEVNAPISIDTYKAIVADQAVQAGASIINDVYGAQREPEIADIAKLYDLPIILMHWDKTRDVSADIISEMKRYFDASIEVCTKAGVPPSRIILDPGFGFAKSLSENYEILRRTSELADWNFPLLIGTSRKSMIGKLLHNEPHERLAGTISTNVLAYQQGGHIFRVHDVQPNLDALKVAQASAYGTSGEIE